MNVSYKYRSSFLNCLCFVQISKLSHELAIEFGLIRIHNIIVEMNDDR